MNKYTVDALYSNSSFDNVNRRLEWNNNGNGTYRFWVPYKGSEIRPIPSHPRIKEIYDFVFDYAMDMYLYGGTWQTCLAEAEEKFGKMSQEMIDYVKTCPYDAGSRAGCLRDDPNHYE